MNAINNIRPWQSPQPGLYCNLQLDISFNEFLFRYHVQNTQPSKRQLVRITHSEEPNLDEGIAAPLSTEDVSKHAL